MTPELIARSFAEDIEMEGKVEYLGISPDIEGVN
jgi:hypothetical protein